MSEPELDTIPAEPWALGSAQISIQRVIMSLGHVSAPADPESVRAHAIGVRGDVASPVSTPFCVPDPFITPAQF